MTLIEGVGDEVVQFMAIVVIFLVGALAWWSTNARPNRYRTVLVMRSRTNHPVTISIRPRTMVTGSQANSSVQATSSDTSGASTSATTTEALGSNARVIPLQEMDSIVDADMAMMNNNRLHFYRRIESPSNTQSASESTSDESETPEDPEPASNAQIREMDSIVNAMEADVTAGCDFFTRSIEPNATIPQMAGQKVNSSSQNNDNNAGRIVNTSEATIENTGVDNTAESDETDGVDRRKILIKLKYLNDTLKEVEGSLDELLKDFKWRHFSSELSAECRVRLIFKGRVLADDAATLQACGLHHHAVLHCLVHPKRNVTQQRGIGEDTSLPPAVGALGPLGTHELITEGAPPERAWDLENILMTLVSVALTVVWFFRCEYSNMFTASASVALFGLTVFYSVAIFGLYLSDTFHIERRPAQPVPNN